ncbi:MAG: acyl carrier protein [Comamonadaceae bacterium]|nr:acyl carrier protein [Comamonadaceae bacterium]
MERVGSGDGFFDLGGTSLTAMQVMVRLCREFDHRPAAGDHLHAPDPRRAGERRGGPDPRGRRGGHGRARTEDRRPGVASAGLRSRSRAPVPAGGPAAGAARPRRARTRPTP